MLEGVFTALVTPFRDGGVDEPALRHLIERQIEAGAPAQVYLSANGRWMDYLAQRNRIEEGSRTAFVGNRLVLIAPAETAPKSK